MISSYKKIILPLLLFGGFFVLYFHNLSRSVYGGDVGDLVTAATVGGVAHPSGYPLFTLLGVILTHQHIIHASPAFLVGAISALSGALGILFFFLINKQLTKSNFLAALASCILGFSFLYWFYAEIAEVFMLNAFFAILLFYLALLYRNGKKNVVLFLFFLFLGLSATHHESIVLIFPSLFLLIGKQFFLTVKKKPLLILWVCLIFLVGLTPFLYIPLAAARNPIINWDRVHDISSFFFLIFRRDYGTFQAGIFSTPSFMQRLVTLQVYLQYIIFQLTIPVVLLSLTGFWKLFLKDKILFFSLLLAWLLSGPAFLLYAGFPLTSGFVLGAYERFVLLSFILFLFPFGLGLQTLVAFLAGIFPKRNYAPLFSCLFLFIPIALFFYNFPKTDLSHFMLGDSYAYDFLRPLPKNAILLISGDTQIFNTWYLHYGLSYRPDVLLYNIGAAPITDSVIAPHLRGIPQSKQMDVLTPLLIQLQRTRPVFSTVQFQPKTGQKVTWVPRGLSFEMFTQNDTLPTKDVYRQQTLAIWNSLHPPTAKDLESPVFHNLSISEIPSYYASSLIASGIFAYSTYKDADTALLLFENAKKISPDSSSAYIASGVVYAGMPNKCADVVSNLSVALSLDRYSQTPYFLLYNVYTTCFKKPEIAKSVAQSFQETFQKDFQKEYKKSLPLIKNFR